MTPGFETAGGCREKGLEPSNARGIFHPPGSTPAYVPYPQISRSGLSTCALGGLLPVLTPAEVARIAFENTGWKEDTLVTAVAIALGESGGDPHVKSRVDKADSKWGVSTGLWQIRPLHADRGTGRPRDETRLTDPVFNARSAYQIYLDAKGFKPWGAYTNGSYKRHLAEAEAAVKEATSMAWRLAMSLVQLGHEVNRMAPNRSKASDGTIGDSSHSSRTSDHNPDSRGVVRARDITHDPANGLDCHKLADQIKDDVRVKYLIWDRRIWNPSISRSWRSYSGSNPHTKHLHVSVRTDNGDNTQAWLEQEDDLAQVPQAEWNEIRDKVRALSAAEFENTPQKVAAKTPRGDIFSRTDLWIRLFDKLGIKWK